MAILCSSFNATFWVELPQSCRVTSSNIADILSVTIVATFIAFIPTHIRGKFSFVRSPTDTRNTGADPRPATGWYPRKNFSARALLSSFVGKLRSCLTRLFKKYP